MKITKISSSPVVDFAAEELKKYLRMMMPHKGEIEISYNPEGKEGFLLGLMEDFNLPAPEVEDPVVDEVLYIDTTEEGGIIAGSNARSVLLAVYAYFRKNGCRWLFPGIDGEFIPVQDVKPVKYRFVPDVKFRGQCNEGAESQTCMMETIDFAPKVGMNVYMIEFDNPKVYYARYYDHANNPARAKETVSNDQILQWKRLCEAEIAKRDLIFHDMGHGWTAESFGISSINGWSKADTTEIPEESREFIAMIDGKRELCKGVALNTNFCMSNPRARKKVTDSVVEYAKKSGHVDYLHVWLADWKKNHCECEECKKMIPSDWYVMLLNEIDEALTKEGLDNRIGGVCYSDTAWEPEKIKLKNPKRFIMNLGAISRSYLYSVEKDPVVPGTPYVRNVTDRLDTMEEYVMRTHRWMEMAPCPYIAYEYHFWKTQVEDPSGLNLAKRLYEDIRSYKENRFEGIIEDGSQRSFFPNGLAYYVYAMSMFDMSLSLDELEDEYMTFAYGEAKEAVKRYLEGIRDNLRMEYLEYIHSKKVSVDHYRKPEELERLKKVSEVCDRAEKELAEYQVMPYRAQTVSVQLLNYHMEYCRNMAQAFILKNEGKDEEAYQFMNAFFTEFGKKEVAIERYYDQHNTKGCWNPVFKAGLEQNM